VNLSSLTSDAMGSVSVLAVLPAHSLTHLDVSLHWDSATDDAAALSAAFARLSNLQHLRLKTMESCRIPSSGLAGVAQLTRLTSLKPQGTWQGTWQDILPLLLAGLLSLCLLRLWLHEVPNAVDLTHLIQLEELAFVGQQPKQLMLPQQLQRLELKSCDGSTLAQILQLHQLQHLKIDASELGAEQLLQLVQQLSSLQCLGLDYTWCAASDLAAVAEVWPQLPQLQDLQLPFHEPVSRQGMAAVLTSAGSCSGLTRLFLSVWFIDGDGNYIAVEQEDGEDEEQQQQQAVHNHVCASLASLTNLRDLSIRHAWIPAGDAIALTALTGLTVLDLHGSRDGVGDAAAIALACGLVQLQRLDLTTCAVDMSNVDLTSALGQLVQLTEPYQRKGTLHGNLAGNWQICKVTPL
jgi:hypothetical protein